MTTKNNTADLVFNPDIGWLIFSEAIVPGADDLVFVWAVEDEFGPEEPEAAENITPERMAELLTAGGVRLETSNDAVPKEQWWTGQIGRSVSRLSTFTLVAD